MGILQLTIEFHCLIILNFVYCGATIKLGYYAKGMLVYCNNPNLL